MIFADPIQCMNVHQILDDVRHTAIAKEISFILDTLVLSEKDLFHPKIA